MREILLLTVHAVRIQEDLLILEWGPRLLVIVSTHYL